MSRIDDLIRQQCPNGVEFRAIGEISEIVRGNGMPKTDFADAGVGCIHYGQIYTYYGTWTTETISFISPEKAAKLAKVDPGDLIVTNTSENVDDVCKSVAWLGEEQIVTGGHATVLKHDQDPKYLAYYLQTAQFHADKKRHATGTKVIDVSAKRLAKIRVPVPPLEVQAEIVRVLDLFQSLEAELEAELEARRRQYAHYRDSLLTFADAERERDLRWVAMGEIFEMKAGAHVPAGEISAQPDSVHPHPCFGGNGIRGFVSQTTHDGVHLVIGRQGALCGNVKRVAGRFFATEHAVVVTPKVDIDMDWAFHMLEVMNLNQYATKSAQPGLAVGTLARVVMPVPPIDEQQRVAAMLDRFDALVNDLSAGLPAELVARRRQYEHYRDRLLSFEEAA